MKFKPFNLDLPESIKNAIGGAKSFTLSAKADGDEVELIIGGIVGDKYDGLGADQVMRMLSENRSKRVNVKLNSPGGLVYDGIAIYNSLLGHEGGVTTTIQGIAGSAASLIAMAGRPVRMAANANLFIHRSQVIALGNAAVMRDAADWLDDIDAGIVETYVAKTGLSKRKVNELLNGSIDGTNLRASEALEMKFVDEVLDLKPAEKKSKAKNEIEEPDSRSSEVLLLIREANNRTLEIAAKMRLEEIGA